MHRTRWFKFHTEEMKYILLKIVKRDLQRKPLFFLNSLQRKPCILSEIYWLLWCYYQGVCNYAKGLVTRVCGLCCEALGIFGLVCFFFSNENFAVKIFCGISYALWW